MRRNIIIIGVVVLLFIIAGVILLILRSNPSTGAGNTGTLGMLPPVGTTTPYNPPAGNTITLGTPGGSVVVNNFYNTAQSVSYDHASILIEATDTYNISYYAPDSSFNIFINAAPFETVRAVAEVEFLKDLGISRADACKLNVKIGTSVDVDPNYAGQNLGLSFCATGSF
jgi:hypothetical protein